MSTIETDLYWNAQEAIVSDFASLVKALKPEGYLAALDAIRKHPDIHPNTVRACEDLISHPHVEEMDRDEDVEAYAAERHNAEIESHLYPSEGFKD